MTQHAHRPRSFAGASLLAAVSTLTAFTAFTAVATLAGCDGADFDSRVELSGYRVIGIEANPPQVASDESVTLRVHDFDDVGEPIAHAWSLCLVDPGPAANAPCGDDALTMAIDGGEEAVVDLGPQGVDLAGRLRRAGPVFTPRGRPATPERGFDLLVTLRSGADCEGCRQLTTVKRVRVLDAPDAAPNDNPRLSAFEVEGKPAAGATVSLRVQADAPQAYEDRVDGESTTETYLYTWYSALGKAEPALTFDARTDTELRIPDDAAVGTAFEVIVAVRDGRGGLAVGRQQITVVR